MSRRASAALREQVSMLPKQVISEALSDQGDGITSRYSLRQSFAAAKLGLDVGAVEFAPSTVFNTWFLGYSAITLQDIEVPDGVVEARMVPPGNRKIDGPVRDAYRAEVIRLQSDTHIINLEVQDPPDAPDEMVIFLQPDGLIRAVRRDVAVDIHARTRPDDDYRFDTTVLPQITEELGYGAIKVLSQSDCAALGRAISLTPAHVPLRNFDR